MSNINNLKPFIELDYPEFNKHKKINDVLYPNDRAFSLKNISGLEWYKQFEQIVINSLIKKKYLPIYRMGDGEYSFYLGKSYINILPPWKLTWKQNLYKFKNLFNTKHTSGSITDGLEEYSKTEKNILRALYFKQIREISNNGILAMGMNNEGIYKKYVDLILKGFDQENIILTVDNYFHVYHVYAMFSSSFKNYLFENRNILIITSLNNEKERKICKYFLEYKVKRIDFYTISKNKSMLEKLNIDKINLDVDLVLIAGGIGSINILTQLKFLNCPCIDIGTLLGNFIEPDRCYDRPYMVSDEIFDLNKIKFLNQTQKRIVKSKHPDIF